jgi:RNA polymerase sigma factor (sigma-70 family)
MDAKEKDENAKQFLPIVKAIAYKYAHRHKAIGVEYDDAYDVSLEAFNTALDTYDAEKGTPLQAWICTVVRNNLSNYKWNLQYFPEYNRVGLENVLYTEDEDPVLLEETLAEKSNRIKDLMETVIDEASPLEKLIIKLYLENYTFCDIGKMLGFSRQNAQQALRRLGKRIEGLL